MGTTQDARCSPRRGAHRSKDGDGQRGRSLHGTQGRGGCPRGTRGHGRSQTYYLTPAPKSHLQSPRQSRFLRGSFLVRVPERLYGVTCPFILPKEKNPAVIASFLSAASPSLGSRCPDSVPGTAGRVTLSSWAGTQGPRSPSASGPVWTWEEHCRSLTGKNKSCWHAVDFRQLKCSSPHQKKREIC